MLVIKAASISLMFDKTFIACVNYLYYNVVHHTKGLVSRIHSGIILYFIVLLNHLDSVGEVKMCPRSVLDVAPLLRSNFAFVTGKKNVLILLIL